MDKSAVGHDYIAPKYKHASQTDYSTGFGGKFGVQSDRIDKVFIGNVTNTILTCFFITSLYSLQFLLKFSSNVDI